MFLVHLMDEVRKIAHDNRAAVYTAENDNDGCEYSTGKCGPGVGCIIGQGFRRLGWHIEDKRLLDELNRLDPNAAIGGGTTISRIANVFFPETPQHVVKFLSIVQNSQDNQLSWGDAIDAAEKWLVETSGGFYPGEFDNGCQ